MAKLFSLLLASALLLVLVQARPEPASSEENKVDSSEEKSGFEGLGSFFAVLGFESFLSEQMDSIVVPVAKELVPIFEKVIQEAEKVTPQSDAFKVKIAKIKTFIETEKKNDDDEESSNRNEHFLKLNTLFERYNELDESNTDDAFFKKTLKENGIEEVAKEFHYRKVVFALDLLPKLEKTFDTLRKDSRVKDIKEIKDIPGAEKIHEKLGTMDLKEKEAAAVEFIKTTVSESNEKEE